MSERVQYASSNAHPNPGERHSLIATEGYLYLFGGYERHNGSPRLQRSLNVWRFNVLSNLWKRLPGLTCNIAAQIHQDPKVVLFGSAVLLFYFQSRIVFLYPISGPRRYEWIPVLWLGNGPESLKLRTAYGREHSILNSGGGLVHNRRYPKDIFLFHPTCVDQVQDLTKQYEMEVFRFRVENIDGQVQGTWRKLEIPNRPIDMAVKSPFFDYYINALVHEQSVYIYPTLYAHDMGHAESHSFKMFDVFHLETSSWHKEMTYGLDGGDRPLIRSFANVLQFKDSLYLLGGCSLGGNGSCGCSLQEQMFDDVWQLSLKTHEWRKLPSCLSDPIANASAAVSLDGCLYTFGGSKDRLEPRGTNNVNRMWLEPPPLKWIMMKTFLQKVPNMIRADRNKLAAFGIPADLVNILLDTQDGATHQSSCTNVII